MPPVDEGIKSLCDSITALTERRLEFDNKLRERAASARPAAAEANSPRCAAAAAAAPPVRRAGRPPGGVSEQEPVHQQQAGALPILGRVTYIKLQGDQLLHLAELARSGGVSVPEFEGIAALALEAYLAARQVASGGGGGGDVGCSGSGSEKKKQSSNSCWVGGGGGGDFLPQLHPLRIELALRISSVLLHMLRRPIEAWEAAYPTYLVAAERPARLGPRGLIITQLLRDHLALIDVRGAREHGDGEHGDFSARGGTSTACGLSSERGGNEWSFLRVSDGLCEEGGGGVVAGASAAGGDKLRALARVRQARAAMGGVVKVLLGTMERASVVHAALKKIFAAYTEKHGFVVPARTCDATRSEHIWLHRQEEAATPQSELPPRHHHGALLLSWPGFVSICRDFKIATTIDPPLPPSDIKLVRTPRPSADQQQRVVTFASSTQTTRRPSFNDWKPGDGYLLDAAHARIAFVSACTHGSVVASFPEEDCRAPREGAPGGPPHERGLHGSEEVYWQDMERMVLSGSTPEGLGLKFPQLVDALARCGLLGFPVSAIKTEQLNQTGLHEVGFGDKIKGANILTRRPRRQFSFAAERTQAVFLAQMRLLDGQHVDTTLLLRAEEEEEAELTPEKNNLAGLSKTAGHPKATRAAAAGAPGGTKSKTYENMADTSKVKRGTARAAVLGMRRPGGSPEIKPQTLTPIEARGKANSQARPRSTPARNGLHRSKSGAT